jgi:hypothetical protein
MQKTARLLALAMLAPALLSALVAPAAAQASRTFVSGTGTDSGSCSRAAPCATFAFALTKTSLRGEINCVDAGEYGAVTIDKAVTISCEAGTAGILSTVAAAVITVNAGTSDDITLRGLDLNAAGAGGTGIDVQSARTVHIENCAFRGFGPFSFSAGLLIQTNTTVFTYVTDSVFSGNTNGINLHRSAGFNVVSLKNVIITGSTGDGVVANDPAIYVNITESVISGNGGSAVKVASTASEANVDRTTMTNNGVALNASASGATIRAIGNNIFDNTTAFSIASGATIATDGQNRTGGNGSGQDGNASLTLQ